jgi:hypothetical protein
MRAGRARAKISIASSNDGPIRALGARPPAVGGATGAAQTARLTVSPRLLMRRHRRWPILSLLRPGRHLLPGTRRSAIPTCGLPRAVPDGRKRQSSTNWFRSIWRPGSRAREAEPEGDPIPRFVERDLRKYLECGILAHGFGRARCGGCGHDFLIAYSCKGRGVCPSCNTRRMAETAAHLVDHVFPQVPVRQWVLSLPKRLRYFLYHEPALIGPVLQIFLDAVEDRLKVSSPGALAEALRGSDLCPSLRLGIECQPPLSLCGHRWCLRCPRGKGAFTKLGCSVLRTSPPCNARRVPVCCGSSRCAGSSRRRPRPRCGNGSTGWLLSRYRGPHRGHGPEGAGAPATVLCPPDLCERAAALGAAGRAPGTGTGPAMPRRGCSVCSISSPSPHPRGRRCCLSRPWSSSSGWRPSSRHHAGTVTAIMASWPRMPRCVRR